LPGCLAKQQDSLPHSHPPKEPFSVLSIHEDSSFTYSSVNELGHRSQMWNRLPLESGKDR
jgi:hypothetical protein